MSNASRRRFLAFAAFHCVAMLALAPFTVAGDDDDNGSGVAAPAGGVAAGGGDVIVVARAER